MVRTCDEISWPCKNHPTRHSTGRKTERQTEKEVGGQHSRMDRDVDPSPDHSGKHDRDRWREIVRVLGPFTQAIFVAATRCNFCRAEVATSKSRV